MLHPVYTESQQILAQMTDLVFAQDPSISKEQSRGIVNWIISNRFPVCLPQYLEEAKAAVCQTSVQE